MSNIVLGEMCRANFGLNVKYDPSLNDIYKGYIDKLEKQMIITAYGNDVTQCTIVQTLNLVISQEDIDNAIGSIRYEELEKALIQFCQLHKVNLNIQRFDVYIIITVNMLLAFGVTYG